MTSLKKLTWTDNFSRFKDHSVNMSLEFLSVAGWKRKGIFFKNPKDKKYYSMCDAMKELSKG